MWKSMGLVFVCSLKQYPIHKGIGTTKYFLREQIPNK